MSLRNDAEKGTYDVTNGSLPTGLKAWGFSPSPGAAFTSCEINNSGLDDKADHGWGVTFETSALRACAKGELITGSVVTGTITFYLA